MRLLVINNCWRLLYRRSSSYNYVDKVRKLDYWKQNDKELRSELTNAQYLVMVNSQPLICTEDDKVSLVITSFRELTLALESQDVSHDDSKICLLDTVEKGGKVKSLIPLMGISVETERSLNDICEQLDISGARFLDVPKSMMTMADTRNQKLLAKFQSLIRWSSSFRHCPSCASQLSMNYSKSHASCTSCSKLYFPSISPATLTLITNPSDTHVLLVRNHGVRKGIYSCVAGYANAGESLQDCARREIAEEVGLDAKEIRNLGISQSWPIPDSSLICAHHAIVDMDNTIVNICTKEIESAKWFSKKEVKEALERTLKDPMQKISTDDEQELISIPSSGALSHTLIRSWIDGSLNKFSL